MGFISIVGKVALSALISVLPLAGASATPPAAAKKAPAAPDAGVELVPEFTLASRLPGGEGAADLGAWTRHVPGIQAVSIPSPADGSAQRAFFHAPKAEGKRPLLVVLHSWSTDWRQNIGVPYAKFAARNGWAFIHPDFRGPYRRPEAAASDLVAQDIVDAVEYAKQHADVDTSRIYLAGFSGGGMTALAMAARRPELWAGVLAWAPVVDLPAWYEHNATRFPKRRYAGDVAAVCGGPPRPGAPAYDECRKRSPIALLDGARLSGVPIYIATGVRDDIVPPDHTLRAFNLLAAPADRIPEEAIRHVVARGAVPAALQGAAVDEAYRRAGAPLRLDRASGRARVVLFEGGHDVVYNPGLAWLSAQRRP